MARSIYESTSDLPKSFPIFPLAGVLLFPSGLLPLNIFEPRYLNMLDDAMAGDAMIGMVQSLETGPRAHPDIAQVGCLGRISSYSETEDGRYLIALEGICRFRITQELPFERPYREAEADWSPFTQDLSAPDMEQVPGREQLLSSLQTYLERNRLQADWRAAENAPLEQLINSLCAACPFTVMEKQALLEAPDLRSRAESLITLFHMDRDGHGGKPTWLQ
ncbi:LON peptidase substrate-binding domain-containing protein [Ponticaulis profundi]|uniref:LON peptidase substrate-binding domain-containing protein n=1 Tax=Ponticaulis profundi TaxID=2665222 RepID=A0ABW1SDK7_9PROT